MLRVVVPALILAALATVGVAGTLAGRQNDRNAVWIGLVQDAQRASTTLICDSRSC